MTSPSLTEQTSPPELHGRQALLRRLGLPLLLLGVTVVSTTMVGMRYMYNFQLGHPPISTDADILPYTWVFHNLSAVASGLPFSITLIAILLAHEFGHYFACRSFKVRSTLPYMLPAPSLSGTFGAVIRLKSRVPSRSALLVIGAAGPIAGFVVAIATSALGILHSTYAPSPILHVQAPLVMRALHGMLRPTMDLSLLIPHPILTASWIGLLITALNLIPAGQLDGGHILYAISPAAQRITSRASSVILILLGAFFWVGWILWGLLLLMPAMRHPKVPSERPLKAWQKAMLPLCLAVLVCAATYRPFSGYSLMDFLHKVPHRYF